MLPYLIFKNINSLDYFIINKLPPIIKAASDIEKVEIDGRDGFLTVDKGTHKSYIKPVECTIKDTNDIDYICSWLEGSGDVIFSNEEDKVYKATIINKIDFSRAVHTFHKFIIQFECQPHKYSIDNNSIVLTSAGIIFNPGTKSEPIIKIYGSGTIDLTINNITIHLTNVNEYVTIDSDLMDCYKDTALKNTDMSGEFPNLISGANSISWNGTVTKVEILPNWRWI